MIDPSAVVLILCSVFSLYLLALSCVFCCFSCRCRCRSCRRRTELDRRAAQHRTAAWARSDAPALMPPWRSASVELMPPLAVPPVEPWSMMSVAALAVKKRLGYFRYSDGVEGGVRAASRERLVCAICLEAFVHGATCSEVPACRHLFHRDCIEVWARSKSTCPLCRATMVPGSERLSAEDMV